MGWPGWVLTFDISNFLNAHCATRHHSAISDARSLEFICSILKRRFHMHCMASVSESRSAAHVETTLYSLNFVATGPVSVAAVAENLATSGQSNLAISASNPFSPACLISETKVQAIRQRPHRTSRCGDWDPI